MRPLGRLASLIIVLVALLGLTPAPASAAQSFDGCSQQITSLPVNISVPGTWCLERSLTYGVNSGTAIHILTKDVTIDCNGFKLDNSGAGVGTTAVGIGASNFSTEVSNIAVRHCTIQGFGTGLKINIDNISGLLVEENQLLTNRIKGIDMTFGAGVIIRRNTVTNTGGGTGVSRAHGVQATGNVIDNVVDGTVAANGVADFSSTGIVTLGFGSVVQGNTIRNLAVTGSGGADGIEAAGTGTIIRNNYVLQGGPTNGHGVRCGGDARVRDNVIRSYTSPIQSSCNDDGGNIAY